MWKGAKNASLSEEKWEIRVKNTSGIKKYSIFEYRNEPKSCTIFYPNIRFRDTIRPVF